MKSLLPVVFGLLLCASSSFADSGSFSGTGYQYEGACRVARGAVNPTCASKEGKQQVVVKDSVSVGGWCHSCTEPQAGDRQQETTCWVDATWSCEDKKTN
jgi:hypothetical protein